MAENIMIGFVRATGVCLGLGAFFLFRTCFIKNHRDDWKLAVLCFAFAGIAFLTAFAIYAATH